MLETAVAPQSHGHADKAKQRHALHLLADRPGTRALQSRWCQIALTLICTVDLADLRHAPLEIIWKGFNAIQVVFHITSSLEHICRRVTHLDTRFSPN